MMTVATVATTTEDDVADIDVDIDDNGYAYIKQDAKDRSGEVHRTDWIALPIDKVPALIAALQQIRIE